MWFTASLLVVLVCVTAYAVLPHQSYLQDFFQQKEAQILGDEIFEGFDEGYTNQAELKNANGAMIFQSLDYGTYSKNLILVNAESGDKILFPKYNFYFAERSNLVDRNLWYIEGSSSIAQYRIDTDEKIVHTLTVKASDSDKAEWQLVDFVVGTGKIVYRVEGPWPEDDEAQVTKPCMIRQRDLRDDSDVEIMRIKDCFAAHGPSYSFEGFSSDGSALTLIVSYGESGYSSIELYEINLKTKTSEEKELVSYSSVCDEGTFYSPEECTQEVNTKNKEYDAFRRRHRLYFGWTEQCGDITITKDEDSYEEHNKLTISGKNRRYEIESAKYLGCLK